MKQPEAEARLNSPARIVLLGSFASHLRLVHGVCHLRAVPIPELPRLYKGAYIRSLSLPSLLRIICSCLCCRKDFPTSLPTSELPRIRSQAGELLGRLERKWKRRDCASAPSATSVASFYSFLGLFQALLGVTALTAALAVGEWLWDFYVRANTLLTYSPSLA